MAQICPTSRPEKLLLPTDGSEFSEGAIREAISLAKSCSSKLIAVSVIETNPEYETLAPQLVEKAEKEARQHLESVKARAEKEGVQCETIARHGDEPYKYIIDEAEKNKVSMIIMGRRGRTGLKRLMMGSVTARVIGHAPCNVVVVPRQAKLEFKSVLVATDGSKFSDAASAEAINIAKLCGAALTVISVVPSEEAAIVHSEMHKGLIADKELHEGEKNVKKIKELAEKEGIKTTGFVYAGKPYEAILEAAKEKKADLIVIGSHGRTGLDRLLMGSVAERVIVLSSCAVLIVKIKG